jgi:hypothetical protein
MQKLKNKISSQMADIILACKVSIGNNIDPKLFNKLVLNRTDEEDIVHNIFWPQDAQIKEDLKK